MDKGRLIVHRDVLYSEAMNKYIDVVQSGSDDYTLNKNAIELNTAEQKFKKRLRKIKEIKWRRRKT